MKKIITILFLGLLANGINAQAIPKSPNAYDMNGEKTGKWTIFYDSDFNITKILDSVEFYRLITYEDGKPQGIVNDYYRSGKKQWEGFLQSDEPEDLYDGECKWFYKKGEIKQIAVYKSGILNGDDSIFNEDADLCMTIKYDHGKIQNYKILIFDPVLENYIYNLAFAYADLKNYSKAIELFLQLLELTEKLYGKEHPNYADALNNLALFYSKLGDYPSALKFYLKELKFTGKIFGKKSKEYSTSLNNVALTYSELGDYSKALELNLQNLELTKQLYGEEHANYAISLNILAFAYSKLGDYSEALKFHLKILKIREKIFGKKSKEYSTSLNNLALTYLDLGDYPKALELNLQDLEITKQLYGEENANYAISLNNLALTYSSLGDYSKALELNLQDVVITEKTSGKRHPDYVKSLSNLAGTYSELGDYSKAKELNIQVLKLNEQLFGKEHLEYAKALNNLANTYSELGEHSKALELYLQDLEITKHLLGKEHTDYVTSLSNLALTYSDLQEHEKALELNLQSLEITEQLFGKEHPKYIRVLNNLAFSYIYLGDITSASLLFQEVLKFNISLYKSYENKLNNNLRADLFNNLFSEHSMLFSIYRKLNNYEQIKNQYNVLCFLKGRELSKNTSMSSIIYDSNDKELINNYEEWLSVNKRIGFGYEKTIKERKMFGLDLIELQEYSDNLERQLTKRSSIFESDKHNYSFDDIISNLKDDEIYIDIEDVSIYNFDKKKHEQSEYYAYVIQKNDTVPQLVPLGSDILLNRAYRLYEQSINDKSVPTEKDNQVYNVFWGKLVPYLSNASTIYFSPDGVYNKINPNILYNKLDNSFLINKFDILFVNNVEDFVNQKEDFIPLEKAENLNAVIIGDPTFNLDKEDIQNKLASNEFQAGLVNQVELDNLQRGTIIRSLPGTKEEINVVSNILSNKGWKTIVYSEEEATEENIKKIEAPNILHIATHGYFFQDENILVGTNSISSDKNKRVSNPMFRSGLLFAGAENTKKGESIATENGWLNSYEVSLLNLRGTELVVLSACETAGGEVQNGKGVYGLQRAIRMAGAESIIMSMWKVDDQATKELMICFYENWIDKKMAKREAFKEAQNKLRNKYIYPYYWGAFIMIGN